MRPALRYLGIVLFTAAGCGSQVSDAAPPAGGLLTSADVPGYHQLDVPDDFPDTSDRPDCLGALNDLDSGHPPSGVADQARVTFALSQAGPWLRETLRRYPDSAAAAAAFTRITGVLDTCSAFRIGWSADGNSGAETVHPAAAPEAGAQAEGYLIGVEALGFRTTENKVLVQDADRLIVIAHSGVPDAPALADTHTLTRTAVLRAAG